MPIEPISKKLGEGEIKLPLDNPAILDALQKGRIQDVHKLLTDYGITAADFEQFAAAQYGKFTSMVVQPEPIYEGEATVPMPPFDDFPQYDPANALSPEDLKTANNAILGKAMTASEGTEDLVPKKGDVQSTLEDWNKFYNDLEFRIIEQQAIQQSQAELNRLRDEYEKILAMARSGQLEDPTILVLALTKVLQGINGVHSVESGMDIMKVNNQMNAAYEALKGNPSVAQMYTAQQDIKGGTTNMQFLMNNLNQLTQNSASLISFAKSFQDAYSSTKGKLIDAIKAY